MNPGSHKMEKNSEKNSELNKKNIQSSFLKEITFKSTLGTHLEILVTTGLKLHFVAQFYS